MRAAELDYELPPELIARYPAATREASRLLHVGAGGPQAALAHHGFADLPELLPPGALLIVNDTRVLAARLLGHRSATGGKVEVLLVRRQSATEVRDTDGTPRAAERWQAMVRSSKRLRVDQELSLGGDLAAIVEQPQDDAGIARLRLFSRGDASLPSLLERYGRIPLPPYLARPAEASDDERYQTVFAREAGAVAAPTAGLHFSVGLVERLRTRGFELATLTLHVGPGTFKPVTCDELDDHPMHSEAYSIPADTVERIAQARRQGRAVIAVGTTVVRALESAADPQHPGMVRALAKDTDLMIQPGYRFRVVDGLITNFHLPGSTLLALVYAFGGTEAVRQAYDAAIEEKYRFYSYGDAMFIAACVSPYQVGAS